MKVGKGRRDGEKAKGEEGVKRERKKQMKIGKRKERKRETG